MGSLFEDPALAVGATDSEAGFPDRGKYGIAVAIAEKARTLPCRLKDVDRVAEFVRPGTRKGYSQQQQRKKEIFYSCHQFHLRFVELRV